jgi:hypothetical protein
MTRHPVVQDAGFFFRVERLDEIAVIRPPYLSPEPDVFVMAMGQTALNSQGLRDVEITVDPNPAPEVWEAAGMEQANTFQQPDRSRWGADFTHHLP